jgi:hypothetical protein
MTHRCSKLRRWRLAKVGQPLLHFTGVKQKQALSVFPVEGSHCGQFSSPQEVKKFACEEPFFSVDLTQFLFGENCQLYTQRKFNFEPPYYMHELLSAMHSYFGIARGMDGGIFVNKVPTVEEANST